jgi:hypothetical protein
VLLLLLCYVNANATTTQALRTGIEPERRVVHAHGYVTLRTQSAQERNSWLSAFHQVGVVVTSLQPDDVPSDGKPDFSTRNVCVPEMSPITVGLSFACALGPTPGQVQAIEHVHVGGPAHNAGLLPADRILSQPNMSGDAEASEQNLTNCTVETCGVTLRLAPDLHDGVKKEERQSTFFFRYGRFSAAPSY